MNGFARRPLALFVACLFAGLPLAYAAEGEAVSTATQDSVSDVLPRLRVERKFNVLSKKRAKQRAAFGMDYSANPKEGDAYPLFIVADSMDGRAGDVTEAEGKVEVRRLGSLLKADKVNYRLSEDEADATGNVQLLQDGGEIRSPHLRLRLAEQVGFAESADYRMLSSVKNRFYDPQQNIVSAAGTGSNSSGAPMMLSVPVSYGLQEKLSESRQVETVGHAERIDFLGENQMQLSDATYSTCKPENPDWYFKADKLALDFDRNEGNAEGATLVFKDVPILYTPVAGFPVGDQRRSGFLHPYWATSTKNGFEFTLPYYWNVAPNYDLTLHPRYLSKRGVQLGSDMRYLDYNFQGFMRFEYLANDEMTGKDRYAYRIEHQHNFGQGLTGLVNWNGVSDDTYWQDFSSRLMQTSQTQLPRQVELNYQPTPWWQGSLQVLRYQTLQPDSSTTIVRPYFLEPQLSVTGYQPNIGFMDFSLLGQFSRFTHQDTSKTQGDRLVLYPQLSAPIIQSAFQIIPKLGLHMTSYSLDRVTAGQDTSYSRVLPIFSLDSTVSFERDANFFGSDYIQTLEPRLYYVRIPYRDQSKLPVFDSGLSDFNFSQIFAENRYTGADRVNDANQLTAALTTRLLDGQTGVERLKAMIGQRYYFSPQRVTITGETTRQADFSNLVASITGLILPKTYSDMTWEYNYKDGRTERFSAGARYQPELGKVFSASYRYTRDPLSTIPTVDQVDFAAQWPISGLWYGVGRYNYSLRDNKVLEAIAGVEYNAGCWATRVVAQRLGAISGNANTTLFFQLELSDFGSLGSNPIGLLRRSVPGYGKINELSGSESRPLSTQ